MHMNTEVDAGRPFTGRVTRAAGGAPKTAKRWLGGVALGLLLAGAAGTAQAQNAAVTTYHNDTLRTGWQQNETVLTPSNAGQLTLLNTLPVNGRITAQPLVVSNQSVNGKGLRGSVVYVVTDQDILYAFDGDTGQKLGSTKFRARADSGASEQMQRKLRGRGNHVHAGHRSAGRPDLPDHGRLQSEPAGLSVPLRRRSSSAPGHGDAGPHRERVGRPAGWLTIPFNPQFSRHRAALLLSGGKLYAAFTSYCDLGGVQTRGWLLGWDTTSSSLAMLPADYLTNLTAPQIGIARYLTTIWMSGYGPSTLTAGDNIYLATGNSAKPRRFAAGEPVRERREDSARPVRDPGALHRSPPACWTRPTLSSVRAGSWCCRRCRAPTRGC